MVSKRKMDYGVNGFRAPIVPRAPRSMRRRAPHKKLVEDSKLCPFDLLAAVAGKLLQESESSASSNIADGKIHPGSSLDGIGKGHLEDDLALKLENNDHGSCAESTFVPETSVDERNLLSNFKGVPPAENDSMLEHSSAHESSDFIKKVDCDIKLGICEDNNTDGNTNSTVGGSICVTDSLKHEVQIGPEVQSEDDKNQIGDLSTAKTSTIKDPIGENVNTNVLINSDSSVQLPLYREPVPLRKHWNNVKLGIRDDDENSFGCNKFSTRVRPLRPHPRAGHRRIRKMLASKYWKASPKLKDCELYKTSDGMSTYYRYRKGIYTRESCQGAPLKKRKLSDHTFANQYDQDRSSGSSSNLPANGMSGTVQGHQKNKDPHVKFSIKSFKVPELYIEVPETATVGSLKRTVMEAVTAILGGGIRVGIALQGKKVRDDSRTLQQAGLSESSSHDALGFTLEPNFTHASPSMTPSPKKHPLVLPCETNQQFQRSPATPLIDSGISNASIEHTPAVSKSDDALDNSDFASSPKTNIDTPMDDVAVVSDSQALIPVSPMNVDALAVVPVNSKPKRSDLSQRRTRRPFSVTEVEALVEAVEKLGTGRWRDVKMRAFENADHRTYVDLKDKWKTLVHTASIAPQQRRGEPVPQDLLNRVLAAHSYWTQNQPKQHAKQLPVEPLKISEEIVGA